MIEGLWELKNSEPVLYTAKAADIIKNKVTGKEYIRGAMKLFKGKLPAKVEDSNEYEFIYLKTGETVDMSVKDYMKEVYVNSMLK